MSKEINELLNTTKKLQENLDGIMKLQQNAINKLPEEERIKLSFFERDIIEMKNALRNGDLSKIQTYLTKYADNSTKR
jgi:hypothetical protein